MDTDAELGSTVRWDSRVAIVLAVVFLLSGIQLWQPGFCLAETGNTVPDAPSPATLKKEIEDLQVALKGNLPEGVALTELIGVDLLDASAVSQKVEQLQQRMERAQEGQADTDEEKSLSIDTETLDTDSEEWGSSPDIDALVLERDRLRLVFLQQPAEAISALLAAEKEQIRLAEEQRAAQAAREAAKEAERQAAAAKQEALDRAASARTEVERSLANERARVEQIRGELSSKQLEFSNTRETHTSTIQQLIAEQADIRTSLRGDDLDEKGADLLYDETRELLLRNRNYLSNAMGKLRAAVTVPLYHPELNFDASEFSRFGDEVNGLKKAVYKANEESEALGSQIKKSRWGHTVDFRNTTMQVNDLRLELLDKLSTSKRSEVLGLGRVGIGQLLDEVVLLRLNFEYLVRTTAAELKEVPAKFTDFFTLGTMGWILFRLIVLVWAFVFVRKRFSGWMSTLREKARARKIDEKSLQTLNRWLTFLESIAPAGLFLGATYLLFWILGDLGILDLEIVRWVFLAIAWYRFCLVVPHRFISLRLPSKHMDSESVLNTRILKSVKLVVRWGFFAIVLMIVAVHAVGWGYISHWLERVLWVATVPLVLVLLRRWRIEIATAYLNGYPSGRLENPMRRVLEKKRGLLVVAAAAIFVGIRSTRLFLQDTFSRFKHTRKAVSFLFLRKLEKQAESEGREKVNWRNLPDSLKAAFVEGPVERRFSSNHFPNIEDFQQHLEVWKEKGIGTAASLIGETGMGRTSWINEFLRRNPWLEPVRSVIDERMDSREELCKILCGIFGIPPKKDTEELISALRTGPKRFVVLDHCENLILRSVGGMEAYKGFSEIIGRTVPNVFWVCSFSRYAFEYVESVLITRNLFRLAYRLDPWPQDTIKALLEMRMKTVGFDVSYEDLVIDRAEGVEFDNAILRTEQRYLQILTDYTEGIPRLVNHFWLRSLVLDGENKVKVQLFKAPSADELETLNEQSRFMLAAMVIHQNLTVREAARVLSYPPHVCEMILGYLVQRDFIGEKNGHYRVTAHWYRAVIRYLRRKHLLYS